MRRSRHSGHLAIPAAMLAALIMAVTVIAPAAASFSSSVPKYPIKSKCVGKDNYGNPTISWRGGQPGNTIFNPYNDEPHGTMYYCFVTYRLGAKTADGDYYAVDLTTVWRGGALFDDDQATAIQYAESSQPTKDQFWDATPTYTSNKSCSATVSVGLNLSIFSVSTDFQVCSGTTVSATRWSTGGDWSTNYALKVRQMETSFVQKVAHGAVPTWTIEFGVPYYGYAQVGTSEWQITRDWHWYSYAPTGTA